MPNTSSWCLLPPYLVCVVCDSVPRMRGTATSIIGEDEEKWTKRCYRVPWTRCLTRHTGSGIWPVGALSVTGIYLSRTSKVRVSTYDESQQVRLVLTLIRNLFIYLTAFTIIFQAIRLALEPNDDLVLTARDDS